VTDLSVEIARSTDRASNVTIICLLNGGHIWRRKNCKLSNCRVRGPSAPHSRRPVCSRRAGVRFQRTVKRRHQVLYYRVPDGVNMQNIGYCSCTHTHTYPQPYVLRLNYLPRLFLRQRCASAAFIHRHYYS